MNVKELIKELKKCDPKAIVIAVEGMDDGCETCGYGSTEIRQEISGVTDFEDTIMLTWD